MVHRIKIMIRRKCVVLAHMSLPPERCPYIPVITYVYNTSWLWVSIVQPTGSSAPSFSIVLLRCPFIVHPAFGVVIMLTYHAEALSRETNFVSNHAMFGGFVTLISTATLDLSGARGVPVPEQQRLMWGCPLLQRQGPDNFSGFTLLSRRWLWELTDYHALAFSNAIFTAEYRR